MANKSITDVQFSGIEGKDVLVFRLSDNKIYSFPIIFFDIIKAYYERDNYRVSESNCILQILPLKEEITFILNINGKDYVYCIAASEFFVKMASRLANDRRSLQAIIKTG